MGVLGTKNNIGSYSYLTVLIFRSTAYFKEDVPLQIKKKNLSCFLLWVDLFVQALHYLQRWINCL